MPSPNAPAIAPQANSLHTKKLVRFGDGDWGLGLRTPATAAAAAEGEEGGDAAMGPVPMRCCGSLGLGRLGAGFRVFHGAPWMLPGPFGSVRAGWGWQIGRAHV